MSHLSSELTQAFAEEAAAWACTANSLPGMPLFDAVKWADWLAKVDFANSLNRSVQSARVRALLAT